MKGKIKIACFFVFVLTVFALTGCSKTVSVNLNDYVTFKFEGVEGKGTCTPELDYNKILKEKEEDLSESKSMSALRALRDIEISVSKSENLKNDEKINVTFGSVNKDDLLNNCGMEVSYSDFETTVRGLEELEKIDLFKGLDIKCSGYNTQGSAWIYSYDLPYDYYFVELKLEKSEKLSNGETVKVIAVDYEGGNLDEKLADKGQAAISKEYDFVVSGLTELTDYDPFCGISLKYKGLNGEATAEIDKDYMTDDHVYSWEYTLDKSENLSNGDVITVTVSYDYSNDIIEEGASRGLKITRTTNEYTVEGVSDPLNDISKVNPDVFTQIKENDINRINEYFSQDVERGIESGSLKGVEYLGSVITYNAPTSWNEEYSGLFNIYKCDVKCSFDDPTWVYWYSLYENVKKNESGEFDFTNVTPVCPADNYEVYPSYVSGEVFTSSDSSHFYAGFKDLDNMIYRKANVGKVVYNDVNDTETEHFKPAVAKVLISDKDGNTLNYDSSYSRIAEADIYNYGPFSINVTSYDMTDYTNGLDGLSEFVIFVSKSENMDISDLEITDIEVIADEEAVKLDAKFIKQYFDEDGCLHVVLFSDEEEVSGKKAAIRSKNFKCLSNLEVKFVVAQRSEVTEEPEKEETEEPEKEETEEPEKEETEEPEKEETEEPEKEETEDSEKEGTEETEKEETEEPEKEETEEPEKEETEDPEKEGTEETEKEEIEDPEKEGTEETEIVATEEPEKEETEESLLEDNGTKYTIELINPGSDKVRMIKTLMDCTGIEIDAAEKIIDDSANTSQVILETDDEQLVAKIKETFEQYGAEITVTEK